MAEMQKRRFYDTTSPVDLIFFARNLLEHIPAADTAAWHAMGTPMAVCGHGGGGGGEQGEGGGGGEGVGQEGEMGSHRGLVEPRSRAVAFLEAAFSAFPGLNLLVYTWNKALRQELRVRGERERGERARGERELPDAPSRNRLFD